MAFMRAKISTHYQTYALFEDQWAELQLNEIPDGDYHVDDLEDIEDEEVREASWKILEDLRSEQMTIQTGYVGYLSAAGYLDRTDPIIAPTQGEVAQGLLDMYFNQEVEDDDEKADREWLEELIEEDQKVELPVAEGQFKMRLPRKDVLCNDVILPGEYNPNRVRLWVISNEYGPVVAVWANNEGDAFDEMVNQGYEHFLIDEEAIEEGEEDYSRLGNAGELCDLQYAHIAEVDLSKLPYELKEQFKAAREEGKRDLRY